MHPRPAPRSRVRPCLALGAVLGGLLMSAACTSPVSIGGAQGDGPREDDTAALLELPGVEHALVSTDPVEDSDYSITSAVVDLAPDADVGEVAGVLEALAQLEAVDGATWVTLGAGAARIDEYGDLVVPDTPVPTVQGRLEDPDSAERAATALVEGTEVAGTPARVSLGEDGIELEVTAGTRPASVAEAALRLVAGSYLEADRVLVLGAGSLRLASRDQVVDARAVQALLELQQGPPPLPPWVQAWAPVIATEYDHVDVEQTLRVSARAPRSATRQERRAVTRWLEHGLDVVARMPARSELEVTSQAEGEQDPLDLYVGAVVPEPGDPRPDPIGDPWFDAASSYLYDRVQKPRVRRTS